MPEMQIMDPTGHTTVKWDPARSEEVEVARITFREMMAKGYSAFRFDSGAPEQKGERIREFDPAAARMVLIPQLVGG